MPEKNYLIGKVPDIAPAAWELLFRLVEEDPLPIPEENENIDVYGVNRGEMAHRRVFGRQLVAVGLACITDDNVLFASEAGERVVLAFGDAYDDVHHPHKEE